MRKSSPSPTATTCSVLPGCGDGQPGRTRRDYVSIRATPSRNGIGIHVEGGRQGTSRLRIGVLASIAHRTPPHGYGPWEQVAATLTEGLAALGPAPPLPPPAESA